MKARVFQLVPVLEPGDAIGNHARQLANLLGEAHGGFIVQEADPTLESLSIRWTEARVEPQDVLVYHAALASQLGQWLHRVRARKVVDYHNITPSEFFRVYDPGLSVALANARHELESLREDVSLAMADSDYSRRELQEMGFARTETVPILIDFSQYDVEPDPLVMQEIAAGKRDRGDLLFVGRISPNKRQEDLIKTFTVYRRIFNPSARLFLVGGSHSDLYLETLGEFVSRLGIEGIEFVGRVTTAQLVAYYRSADLFVSMSEHEGFGVTFLEAMYLGLPVLAYAAAAVPEAVASAGVLFATKNYEEIAALIDLLMRDDGTRSDLIAAGQRRIESYRSGRFEAKFIRLIEEVASA